MGLLIPWAWVTLGMAVPLSGTVVDGEGKSVAGATIWLGDTHAKHEGPEVLATAEADEVGRFRLGRAEDLAGRGRAWSPTLWAYKPGLGVGHVEFKGKVPGADEPVRIVLGPPSSTPVRALRVDGSPAAGARVRVGQLSLRIPRPPDKMLDRLAATADADGRATLDGFTIEEIFGVDVTLESQITQFLAIDPDSGTITVRAVGRLKVRVVADDPKVVQGWKVVATMRPDEPGYKGPYTTQWADEITNAEGRADFPPLSEGQVLWQINPPEGSDYLVANQPTTAIRAGTPASVEIPVRRGVRVEGVIRQDPEGTPIEGIQVRLMPLRPGVGSPTTIAADAQGRFSGVVMPGTIRFDFAPFDMPKGYFLPPGIQTWSDFDVKEGEQRHALDPPSLRKAAQVLGRVVDELGAPVAGANVSGSWSSAEYGRNPNSALAQTDARGEFALGSIAPRAEVKVAASVWPTADSASVTIPSAGSGEPITLQLRTRPTLALAGRVLGDDGRPLAGAAIEVKIRDLNQRFNSGADFAFEGSKGLQTGPDGRFRTPAQIPEGNQYQVRVKLTGFEPADSTWVESAPFEIPDLKLRRAVGRREVAGRVVDSAGRPISGVEVFQSGDGPKRTQGLTDADGRFRVVGIPKAPALLFASKAGYRFLGKRLDPGDRAADFALRRDDEPPAAPLRVVAAPAVPRDEERSIARALVAAARKDPGGEHEVYERRKLPEIGASLDPDRSLAQIENQVLKAEPAILAAVIVARAESDPRAALELLDAVEGPDQVAATTLLVLDRLEATLPVETRRKLLDKAERSARESAHPGQAAATLADVAGRWLDLGEIDRGSRLVRDAQALAARPTEFPSSGPPRGLIEVLARVDLPAALKLIERPDPQQPRQFDHERAAIAVQVAATDPAEARRLLGMIDESWRYQARRACLRMATKDLPAARALAAENNDPILDALLPAMAARGLADTDPAAAPALLLEAVEKLGKIDGGSYESTANHPSPAIALARLVPLATRIDPDRAPGYLWFAISRRGPLSSLPDPKPIMPWHRQHYLDLAELANLTARYDRDAAEVVFAPVAARLIGLHDAFWGLNGEGPALYRAAGVFDARIARSLLDALPEDPSPPVGQERSTPGQSRQHSKAQARIALAEVLALPPGLRGRNPQPNFFTNDWLAEIGD